MANNLVQVIITAEASSAVSGFNAASQAAASMQATILTSSSGTAGALEGVSSSAGLLGVAMEGAAVVATAALAALVAGVVAVGAAMVDATSQAVGFQTLLTNIQNNTTMTTADVGVMHDAILKLAGDTGTSFDQLGQGFMKIVNVTGDSAHAMDILSVANESAVSTGGNAAKTANILANALHEYGKDTSNAATEQARHNEILANASHMMGVFHLAAAEGNMTLEQFANNSGKAVGLAANLKVGVEDVAAAEASLTKHGFDAAQAQTQVVGILEHMIHPSKAARDAVAELSKAAGVDLVSDFSAAGLASKGLSGVVDDLRQAYMNIGLTEAQATQETMNLVAAQRGGLGMAALLGTGYHDYKNILADLNDTTKTAAITHEAFMRTQETVGFQFDVLKAKVQVAAEQLGERFLPTLSSVLSYISSNVVPVVQQGMNVVFDVLGNQIIPTVSGAFSQLAPIVLQAAQAVWTAAQKFVAMAESAYSWGANIVAQFANGMISAMQPIFDAISTIGQAIASLMMPGSPPKFLPDIDVWGHDTAQVYLDAWTTADASAPIDAMGGNIKNALTKVNDQIQDLQDKARVEALQKQIATGKLHGDQLLLAQLEVQKILIAEQQRSQTTAAGGGTGGGHGGSAGAARGAEQLEAAQRAAALAMTDSAGKVKIWEDALKSATPGTLDYAQAQTELARAQDALKKGQEAAAKHAEADKDALDKAKLADALASASAAEKVKILDDAQKAAAPGSLEAINLHRELTLAKDAAAKAAEQQAAKQTQANEAIEKAQLAANLAAADGVGKLDLLAQARDKEAPGSLAYIELTRQMTEQANRNEAAQDTLEKAHTKAGQAAQHHAAALARHDAAMKKHAETAAHHAGVLSNQLAKAQEQAALAGADHAGKLAILQQAYDNAKTPLEKAHALTALLNEEHKKAAVSAGAHHKAVGPLAAGLGGLGSAMGGVKFGADGMAGAMAPLPALTNAVKGATDTLAGAHEAYVTAAQHVKDAIQGIKDKFQTVMDYMHGSVLPGFDAFRDRATPIMSDFKTFVHDTAMPQIKEFFDFLVHGTADVTKAFVDGWPQDKQAITDVYDFVKDNVFPMFRDSFKDLTDNTLPDNTKAWQGAMGKSKLALDDFDTGYGQHRQRIKDGMADQKTDLLSIGNAWSKKYDEILKSTDSFTLDVHRGLVLTIGASFTAAKGNLSHYGQDWKDTWADMTRVLGTEAKHIEDDVNSIPAHIKAAFSGMGTLLVDAGKAVMDGLGLGLDQGWASIATKMAHFTNMIPQLKGPPEEDKVLLYDNGKLIMQGLADGLREGTGSVSDLLGVFTTKIPEGITQQTVPAFDTFSTILTQTTAAAKGATDQFEAWGTYMSSGFALAINDPHTGLLSYLDNIKAKVDGIIFDATAAKGALNALGNTAMPKLPDYSGGGGGGAFVQPGSGPGPSDPGQSARAGAVVHQYNMTVNTAATAATVQQDFHLMRAMAGG